jgi:hypothetical protein
MGPREPIHSPYPGRSVLRADDPVNLKESWAMDRFRSKAFRSRVPLGVVLAGGPAGTKEINFCPERRIFKVFPSGGDHPGQPQWRRPKTISLPSRSIPG